MSFHHGPFVVVSFEGPDPYSQAGGLGVRISGLVETLSDAGFATHLFFIGDPTLPGAERRHNGRLVLHRWAQWISANSPRGVYDGEEAKVADVSASLPPHVVDQLIRPAVSAGNVPVVLLEEWQTAEAACRISEQLQAQGLRDRVLIVWNANNPYGFERIDWHRLASAVMITTVSRHMRSIIRACGVDARVIPNGLPETSFSPVEREDVTRLRSALNARPGTAFLFKMARWEREKGWAQALDAVAHLRHRAASRSRVPVLIARGGGPTGVGETWGQEAARRRLRVVTFDSERAFTANVAESIRAGVDVVSLHFGVSSTLARALYAAADGVLANSVSEPFGLVGLEAMAAGGVAYTGGTGEDYAVDRRNAVVLETLDPEEIVSRWDELSSSPELMARLRRGARRTAREYGWRAILASLMDTLAQQAHKQGLLPANATPRSHRQPHRPVSRPRQMSSMSGTTSSRLRSA